MASESLWMAGTTLPHFEKLGRDLTVDAAVIGGGITGVTTAYLLKKAGMKVALLERDRCARVDTGHTTAHLTYVTDARLRDLVKKFGPDHAQAVWDAGNAALNEIEKIIAAEKITCGFRRVPGYLHAPLDAKDDESSDFREEAELAAGMGFEAHFMPSVPLVNRPGIRFANQAKFNPLQYIAALLPRIHGRGSHVFENSEVEEEVAEKPMGIRAAGHTIRCKKIIICTHVPLVGKSALASATLFQTKLASFSSYAIAARLPRGRRFEASFWDTQTPYYYLRIDKASTPSGHDTAVFGGLDHKTGQDADPDGHYKKLEEVLGGMIPNAAVTHRWSGQVVETPDMLPYIGKNAPGQFISTGYGGNGMTFGTLAAMMARDFVLGHKNPWADLFDVHRKPLRGAWDYLRQNLDYPYYLLKDRLMLADGKSLRGVARGQGKIVMRHGKRVAAYRGPTGKLTVLSPICTHMGCLVKWNKSESTWDCPCHGSRFKPTGAVLAGPAEDALGKAE